MGSLLVLDTRTRNISQQEEGLLHTGAKAAVEALEVRTVAPPIETTIKHSVRRTTAESGLRV